MKVSESLQNWQLSWCLNMGYHRKLHGERESELEPTPAGPYSWPGRCCCVCKVCSGEVCRNCRSPCCSYSTNVHLITPSHAPGIVMVHSYYIRDKMNSMEKCRTKSGDVQGKKVRIRVLCSTGVRPSATLYWTRNLNYHKLWHPNASGLVRQPAVAQ